VRDFRNDVILAEACRQDVDHYCASVKPGDGKVHQCLVDHQDSLTVACRAETNHLSITAASNVELSPSLGKACASERDGHCKGVTPGKARVFNCLLANADKVCRSLLCSTPATSWWVDASFVVSMHVLLHTSVAELDCQLPLSDYADILMRLAAAMSLIKPALALSQDRSNMPSPWVFLSYLIKATRQSLFYPVLLWLWCAMCCGDMMLSGSMPLTIAVQMNMTASCNSNLKATQGNRLRNWRLDYGVRKQCKADVSKVRSSQVLQSVSKA